MAHRFAWLIDHDEIPPGKVVRHECDVFLCVRHLLLGTDADNVRDALERGQLIPLRGERHGRALFSEAEVEEIRALLEMGWEQRDLGRMYGAAKSTIGRIARGETWRR